MKIISLLKICINLVFRKTKDMSTKTNSAMNIVWRKESDTLGWGKLGPFEVLMILEGEYAGYINATKLCNGADKQFRQYQRLESSKTLIEALEKSTGINKDDLVHTLEYTSNDHKGIFVHPKLIVHIAIWCSAEYGLAVSDIVLAYHAKELQDKIEEAKEEKESILSLMKKERKEAKAARKEAREEIEQAKLERKQARAEHKQARADAEQARAEHKELKDYAKIQQKKIDSLLNATNYIQDQNDSLESHIMHVKTMFTTASTDRVMPTSKARDYNVIAIVDNGSVYLNPNAEDDAEDERPPFSFTVIRAARANINSQCKRIQRKYPESFRWRDIDNPNAIVGWKYYLQRYGHKIVRSGNQFNLVEGYSVRRFWRHVMECNEEKMDDAHSA